MSCPSKRTQPALGAISPVSWPISVVLPAPFGPMTACSSPGTISSMMLSEATTPPNVLVRPSTRSSGSAMAGAREQAVDPAAGEQHDEQEQRTDDDRPVFGDPGQRLLEHQQRDRADHRPDHR